MKTQIKLLLTLGVMAGLSPALADGVQAAEWQSLGSAFGGTNLVTDGTNLYRVGSGTSIWQYDGVSANTWTLIADTSLGNPNPYGFDRGNYGRSYFWNGKIVCSNAGNQISVFDLASKTWTLATTIPLSPGATYGWSQGVQFNPVTGMLQERWTEQPYPVPYDPYNEAWLNLNDGSWTDRVTVAGPVPYINWSEEYTSNKIYAIKPETGNQIVKLDIYDLSTQPSDFTGAWVEKTYDLGAGRTLYWANSDHPYKNGADNLAIDPATGKVYLSSSLSWDAGSADYVGVTLAYDPATDTWEDDFPLHHGTGGYAYYNACIAGGYLFTNAAQSGGFQALQLPAPLLGDTDNNGVVDVNDLNNIFNNLGTANPAGDTDHNGVVDVNDLNNVFNNLGTVGPSGGEVPEPGMLSLLAFTGLAIVRRRK